MNKYFEITSTSICRDDLRSAGFTEEEISNVTDDQMRRIASKMADDYVNNLYWQSLQYFADLIINEK